jgi:hypothetical protein
METIEANTDFEVRSLDAICVNESHLTHKWYHNLKYLVVGVAFGVVFLKAEIISWFRIQEMFRFQSFHMYGVIGSAVVIGAISVFLIKKFNIKTIYGEDIEFHPKKFKGPDLWWSVVWLRLGHRCMSRSIICADRIRRYGDCSNLAQCDCRNLGLWIYPGKSCPLILTRRARRNGSAQERLKRLKVVSNLTSLVIFLLIAIILLPVNYYGMIFSSHKAEIAARNKPVVMADEEVPKEIFWVAPSTTRLKILLYGPGGIWQRVDHAYCKIPWA